MNNKIQDNVAVVQHEILTPAGWQPIGNVMQTVPYKEYKLETFGGLELNAADQHIVITENGQYRLEDLDVGQRVITAHGTDIVASCQPTGNEHSMYDVEVDDEQHIYYTNGIASHNTTTTMAYLLHYAITNPNKTIAILANKGATAEEVLDRIKFAYEMLPWWVQVGVKTWNKRSVELGNGTKILTASTSGSSIRGKSISVLYLDELAHVQNDVEFFTSTYPVISSGKSTKVIITSTPKGLNLFYKLWSDAVEGRNEFKTYGYDWSVVPGRDEAWRDETIANTSPVQFAQEYECSFQGSSNTLISGHKLQQLAFVEPINSDKHLSTYANPEPGHQYCMTVDVAEGLGQDFSVASVFDVTSMPYKLVAVYRNNLILPVSLTEVAYRLGTHYNNAFTLVENNSIGKIVADSLFYDYEYENLFKSYSKAGETSVSFRGAQPGIRTTTKTKAIGCSQLKSLIESDTLLITDFDAINELSTFTTKGRSYAADKGKHDDVVMTLVHFAWFTAQPYFADSFDVDVRAALRDNLSIDSNISFMFVDDGLTELHE